MTKFAPVILEINPGPDRRVTNSIVVIDTDVLVSTAAHPNKTFAVWEAVRSGRLIPIATESTLTELEMVAARPKVREALPLLAPTFPAYLAEYRRFGDGTLEGTSGREPRKNGVSRRHWPIM